MYSLPLLVAVCAFTTVLAAPVKLQGAVEVDGWTKGSRANPDVYVDVVIALRNRGMTHLNEEVLAVSSPRSPRYGQHLTPAELAEITAPQRTAHQTVGDWLTASGIEELTLSRWGDRYELRASISQLETVFATQVHQFTRGFRSVLQAGDLHAPPEVAAEVAAVFGLHGTPLDRPRAPESSVSAAKVTPELLKQHYGIAGVEISRSSENRRATVEFQSQYTAQKDLSDYFAKYVPDAKPGDETFTCFPGDCEPTSHHPAGVEAMLDVEYIMGPAPGIKTEVWSFQSSAWCTDLKNWTSKILDHDDPPRVFSVSYGIQGNVSLDKQQGCSEEIALNIEEDFSKIAARGVSLVFSSGDDGSGGLAVFKHPLWPVWPGSAPHVTSVGATQFAALSGPEERAVTSYGSGGGFSWRFSQQPWQQQATEAYKKNSKAGLPDPKDYNPNGRGTPDISALGLGYQVVCGGHTLSVGGTSASAPFFASLVSLLNEYRLQNGKSPLGFLNPLLYEMAQVGQGFTDVTVGNNRKDRSGIPVREGYSCTEGWDAVTGWGTPVFGEILEYVKSLPSGRRKEELLV